MFTTIQTTPINSKVRTRRAGLLAWLVRWNAAHRERANFDRLTAESRRDMGFAAKGCEKITIAEILAR